MTQAALTPHLPCSAAPAAALQTRTDGAGPGTAVRSSLQEGLGGGNVSLAIKTDHAARTSGCGNTQHTHQPLGNLTAHFIAPHLPAHLLHRPADSWTAERAWLAWPRPPAGCPPAGSSGRGWADTEARLSCAYKLSAFAVASAARRMGRLIAVTAQSSYSWHASPFNAHRQRQPNEQNIGRSVLEARVAVGQQPLRRAHSAQQSSGSLTMYATEGGLRLAGCIQP